MNYKQICDNRLNTTTSIKIHTDHPQPSERESSTGLLTWLGSRGQRLVELVDLLLYRLRTARRVV